MRRVKARVRDADARSRLESYRLDCGPGPHNAATLADVIWPGMDWTQQGAGGAASRVLKRLGCPWTALGGRWGWLISFKTVKTKPKGT